jgi:hypothetical protein
MTDEPREFEDSHIRKRKLPVATPSRVLARHPDDGFILAALYPLGSNAKRALFALIAAFCPPAPAPTAPDMAERIADHVRRFMAYMPPLSARALWFCILLLDWSPVFLFRAPSRLQKLPTARASLLLSEMVSGRLAFMRTIVVAVRGLVLSAYFDQDEVHRAMGYEPIPFLTERIARRKQLLLEPAPARAGGTR